MYRFACAAVLVVCLVPCAPVSAQSADPAAAQILTPPNVPVSAPLFKAAEPLALSTEHQAPRTAREARPSALVPLYASFAALQVADFHSTTAALAGGGAAEANPVMSGIAGNRAAFAAVKAASTVGVIWVGEKLWKKNRAGAIVLMAVANGVMTVVVAHNYTMK